MNGGPSFFKFLSKLDDTPPEQLTAPHDEGNVTARFKSEASKILPTSKMRSLVKVRNVAYGTRTVKFHWDLSSIVETWGAVSTLDEKNSLRPSIAQQSGEGTS